MDERENAATDAAMPAQVTPLAPPHRADKAANGRFVRRASGERTDVTAAASARGCSSAVGTATAAEEARGASSARSPRVIAPLSIAPPPPSPSKPGPLSGSSLKASATMDKGAAAAAYSAPVSPGVGRVSPMYSQVPGTPSYSGGYRRDGSLRRRSLSLAEGQGPIFGN